jgi:tetratricopeptide (TPR) repeat protein
MRKIICVPAFLAMGLIASGCIPSGHNLNPSACVKPVKHKGTKTDISSAYYYLESRFHIKNNEIDKAIDSLKKAIAKDPGSFILTRDLVNLYMKTHQKAKAVKAAERLAKIAPNNADALRLIIHLEKKSMDRDRLIKILKKIIKLDPDTRESFLRLGRIYMKTGDNDRALELFKKMADRFPDYYVARFYLGTALLARKKYNTARLQFLKTIELAPDLMEPRFQLIKIYQAAPQSGDTDKKIIKAYQEILELDPGNYRARLGIALYEYKAGHKKKAQAFFKKLAKDISTDPRLVATAFDEYITAKRYKDAVIVFSCMLKAEPESSTLNFFTAIALEAAKDYAKAITHYLRVRPDHPRYKRAILSIAMLYRQLGKKSTAVNFLEDKARLFPKDIDIITYLASFYEEDHNFNKAISLLKRGIENSPQNTALLFRLGIVQDKAGLRDQCFATMKKVIRIDPENASALNYLGYSYADLGIRLDEALTLLKKAWAIRPDDGYITDSLGWVYYKMGDLDKAVKYLEKAAGLTSFDPTITEHLADAYKKSGNRKKALETYKKALENLKEKNKKKRAELKHKINLLHKNLNDS